MAPGPGGARRSPGRWDRSEQRKARKLGMTREEWERFVEYCESVYDLVCPKPIKRDEKENRLNAEKSKKTFEEKRRRRAYEKARRELVKRLPRVEREREKRAKKMERAKQKLEKRLPSKWRRAIKKRQVFEKAVRTVQRARERSKMKKKEFLAMMMKTGREKRRRQKYREKNQEIIRVITEKVRRGYLGWAVRKSIDEDDARARKTTKRVPTTMREDGNKISAESNVRDRIRQRREKRRTGVETTADRELEASAAERRRKKMGQWESPPLRPPKRKREGAVITEERGSKRRALRWGEGSSLMQKWEVWKKSWDETYFG